MLDATLGAIGAGVQWLWGCCRRRRRRERRRTHADLRAVIRAEQQAEIARQAELRRFHIAAAKRSTCQKVGNVANRISDEFYHRLLSD